MFSLEITGLSCPVKMPKAVMFDFDGTTSVLREGWHEILTNYFVTLLQATPKGKTQNAAELTQLVHRSIEPNIGKLPLFQFYTLIELLKQYGLKQHGGQIADAEFYLADYYRSLLAVVEERHGQLRSGRNPDELMLPGTVAVLDMFRRRNVKRYLVSGTEQEFIRKDCELLQITEYFDGGIFGGTKDIESSSKKAVITRIISENGIKGSELISFGDGQTETREVKAVGGFAVGVASNEDTLDGINQWKRRQLIEAGADWIIPHFGDAADHLTEIEHCIFH
ncbi:MAG: haloacid dehalogenase-like hydrolase [Planctomycetaceae bacterium]|jgi:phosphoglycolate phosphatase-like HAD superfamily hydrolase|nr:haloacid dehalogenase-like hydrolase [Planctomycetaceae bacterium]